MSNNRMQLVIAGVQLTISTAEEESYVYSLAQTIDEDMQTLLSKTRASITSAALLLAIDYLDRYQKSNISATNMRTQIKGYLTDAATAKLLFDEEKKRSDMYAREVGELTSRLEQSQVGTSRGEDIKMLMEEHNALLEEHSVLLEERASILKQLDYANNLLNTSVASREEEIVKLQNEVRGYIEQLDIKTNQLVTYEKQLRARQEENDKLMSEVDVLENLLKEYINNESAASSGQNMGNEFGSLGYADQPQYNDNPVRETPPLFYQEPVKELPYEYDDMPNLNWTENL